MKIRLRVNKSNTDSYVLNTNHIPRYKEFIEVNNHRYVVEHVSYLADEVFQDTLTDVIIYVTEIY